FEYVGRAFSAVPEVRWLTSRVQLFWNHEGRLQTTHHAHAFARTWFYRGWTVPISRQFKDYVMQEATFWRHELWEQAGGHVDSSLKAAGDFELWARFFEHADLVNTETPLAGFRYHSGQISADREGYNAEAKTVLAHYRHKTIHNPVLQSLAKALLKVTGRGGQRFGSRQPWIYCPIDSEKWSYRWKYCI